MNARIQQLAVQAGLQWRQQPPHFSNTDNPIDFPQSVNGELERFAALIIEECTNITLDYSNPSHYEGWLDYRDAITDKFKD